MDINLLSKKSIQNSLTIQPKYIQNFVLKYEKSKQRKAKTKKKTPVIKQMATQNSMNPLKTQQLQNNNGK